MLRVSDFHLKLCGFDSLETSESGEIGKTNAEYRNYKNLPDVSTFRFVPSEGKQSRLDKTVVSPVVL